MSGSLTAVVIAALVAMPPAQYDYPPTVPYKVEIMQKSDAEAICGDARAVGCYLKWYNSTVYLRSDLTPGAREIVLRHELGHVNGWPAHPER